MSLSDLQRAVNGKKDKRNDFAKFDYRNVEAMLAQIKPLMPEGAAITFSDTIQEVAGHPFLVATVTLTFAGGETHTSTGAALHAMTKKGMDPAQITGSCSTYARKYALQGLLAIDDGSGDPDGAKEEYQPAPPDPLAAMKSGLDQTPANITSDAIRANAGFKAQYDALSVEDKVTVDGWLSEREA